MMSDADKIDAFLAGATEAIEQTEREISQIVHENNDSGYAREVLERLTNIIESTPVIGGSNAGSREGVCARRAIARTLIWLIKNEL